MNTNDRNVKNSNMTLWVSEMKLARIILFTDINVSSFCKGEGGRDKKRFFFLKSICASTIFNIKILNTEYYDISYFYFTVDFKL